MRICLGRSIMEEADHRHCRLLPMRRHRACRRAAESRDELSSPHDSSRPRYTPYHILEGRCMCITAKVGARLRRWIKIGKCSEEQSFSDPKAKLRSSACVDTDGGGAISGRPAALAPSGAVLANHCRRL